MVLINIIKCASSVIRQHTHEARRWCRETTPAVYEMLWSSVVVLAMVGGVLGCRDFPPGFQFGAATSAYQVEGAWNVSGRGPSVWDELVHSRAGAVVDGSSGDVACDSYHQWRRDVEMVTELGLDFYRFSLSWTRLFPDGFTNRLNDDGRRYYDELLDALVGRGVTPVVTLYHWDLPQNLQDLGGWTNPLVVEWFAKYARAVFELFADRVGRWVTINEPLAICDIAYLTGAYAPGVRSPGVGNYLCARHVLLAHAHAWRVYDREFRARHRGTVSFTNIHLAFEPAPGADDATAELARQLFVGLYTYPVFSSRGGWPPAIEKAVALRSVEEGYEQSRLPPFTQKEKELVRGTYDFYGFNYYTGRLVREARKGEEVGLWPLQGSSDLNLVVTPDPRCRMSNSTWLYVYPKGIRRQLKWVRDHFGDVEVFITENGYADTGGELDDQDRVRYYREHLEQVLLAMYEDGVNVTGYTAWSLMDNFEWDSGYTYKFGLYAVDFTSERRTRTPRTSAHYYAALVRTRALDPAYSSPHARGAASTPAPYTRAALFLLCILFIRIP